MGLQMGLNTDYISLICTAENATLGEVVYIYKIENVYTEAVSGVRVDNEGDDNDNGTLVIIPSPAKCSEAYLTPKQWEKLTVSQKGDYFTYRLGDYVLINETPVGCTSLEEIKSKYDNMFAIQKIKEFNKLLPHFELICR